MKKSYYFGTQSLSTLQEVHSQLQAVAQKALDMGIIDFTAYEGRRTKTEQNRAYALGRSKLQWPDSKHNVEKSGELSLAVDIVPYVNGGESWHEGHCILLAGVVLAAASSLGINIIWGGNWDDDGEPITDQKFNDLVHFELEEE